MSNINYAEDIIKFAKKNNIKYTYKKKKHYGHYPYMLHFQPAVETKIVKSIHFNLNSDFEQNLEKIETQIEQLKELSNAFKILLSVEDEIAACESKAKIQRQYDEDYSKILMTDPQEVHSFIEDHSPHIIFLSSPIIGDKKVDFSFNVNYINRDRLYYGKYRYKITIDSCPNYYNSDNFYKEVFPSICSNLENYEMDKDWKVIGLNDYYAVDEYRKTRKIKPGYRRKMGYYQREPHAAKNFKIYLSDEELYGLFKMIFVDHIISSDEIILNSEIG